MSTPPLTGLRVVELARILAGPWAGQTLADLGAEVIKVEAPAGDDTRSWGPPFVEREGDTSASYFHACNRGKKSVVIDFRTPEGADQLRALIGTADVLIENFKVGGLAKYGFDYNTLSADFPRLIYCSITGFGQTGPLSHRAGYDFLMQGMSGLMSITGDETGEPQKAGVAITDIFTGLYSVIAIQAALRAREETGKGQHIDMALLDTAVAVTANQGMNYLTTGVSPGLLGNAHKNIVPYRVVPVSDGHMIIAVGNDRQYRDFCTILGLAGLGTDPRFDTNAKRVENRDVLVPLLEAETIRFTKADLLAECEARAVPCGPINTMEEVFAGPQVIDRGLHLDLGEVPSIRSPIRMSDSPLSPAKASPKLGADTDSVLKNIK